MTRRKFEKGMRVKVTHPGAPSKFKDRIGTIRDKEPYEGYVVEFDDNPNAVEKVASSWMELLTLDLGQRIYLEATPQDIEKRRSPRYGADCVVAIEFHGHRVIGQCIDYSQNGFAAILKHDLPLGWIVTVEFPLKDRKPVRIQARPSLRKRFKVWI